MLSAAVCAASGVAAPADAAAMPSDRDAAAEPSADDAVFLFDIPSQPLEAALDQFAVVSGRSALYSSAMVAGRMSAALRGRHTPERALRRMLAGTGLAVEHAVSGRVEAFVIKRADAASSGEGDADEGALRTRLAAFDRQLQAQVWSALCRRPLTAASNYQSVLRFEVTQSGRLARGRLIGSTGDPRRDAALLDALGSVRMGSAPPAELAQPVTLLILPGRSDRPACPAGAG